jgi:hypothetical protein
LRLDAPEEIGAALHALGLAIPQPVLVLVGGASQATDDEVSSIDELVEPLVATAARLGAAIVDGGTDAGVMQAAGEARARIGSEAPLVGVVPAGLVDDYELEPNHSHFLLVPGAEFGAESPWIARIAGELAGGRPSVTVLLGGGEVTWLDAAASVAAGRRILAVKGSGRAADELALGESERARDLRASGLVELLDLGEDRTRLLSRVEECLRGQ